MKIYNNIVISDSFPPLTFNDSKYHRSKHNDYIPPYIQNPPDVVNIKGGRQLFVDTFLIQDMKNIQFNQHQMKHNIKPIIAIESSFEKGMTAPLPDAVIYDKTERKYKMWYVSGITAPYKVCIATSTDGHTWIKPKLNNDVKRYNPCCDKCKKLTYDKNSNIIGLFGGCQNGKGRGSATVLYNVTEKNKNKRYKLFFGGSRHMSIYYSADGITWKDEKKGGYVGGAPWYVSYNPFRKKYIFFMRDNLPHINMTRTVRYKECDKETDTWGKWCEQTSYGAKGNTIYSKGDPIHIAVATKNDISKDKDRIPGVYAMNSVPYESLMINLMVIYHSGNSYNKSTSLYCGYSRDGFHYTRYYKRLLEDTKVFKYIMPAGGNMILVNDEIYLYYSYMNDKQRQTNYAKIRRDGFVSMSPVNKDKVGEIVTRKLQFNGKNLFINCSASNGGYIKVELLDKSDKIIPHYSKDECIIIKANKTKINVKWNNKNYIPENQNIKIKFHVFDSLLYSFWIE